MLKFLLDEEEQSKDQSKSDTESLASSMPAPKAFSTEEDVQISIDGDKKKSEEAWALMGHLAKLKVDIFTPHGDYSEQLSAFLEMKKNPNIKTREQIFSKFNEQRLGKENWIIGLISMLYDQINDGEHILVQLVDKLLGYLGQDLEDDFFSVAILEALRARRDALPDKSQQQIKERLREFKLERHQNPKIRDIVRQLLQKEDLKPLYEFSLFQEKKTTESMPAANAEALDMHELVDRQNQLKAVFQKNIQFNAVGVSALLISSVLDDILKSHSSFMYACLDFDKMVHQIFSALTQLSESKIAILTHPSISIYQSLESLPGLRVVDVDPLYLIGTFFENFQSFFEQGYETVYALLPDAKIWPFFHYATHASAGLEPYIKVVDTQTVGVGLGVIVQQVFSYISQQGKSLDVGKLDRYIQDMISVNEYFVIAEDVEYLKKQFWFQRLTHGQALRQSKYIVIKMSQQPIIISYERSITSAFQLIQKKISHKLRLSEKCFINFSEGSQVIKQAVENFKMTYPNLKVNSIHTNKQLQVLFGSHIGISTF